MADMDIDPQISPQGDPIPQNQPLSLDQVRNPVGGYVYEVDDFKRLERFLCLGNELGYYKANSKHKKFSRSEVKCIDRLIAKQKGREVVKTIKDISVLGRACKQNPILYSLAVCARSHDQQTKLAAYSVVNDVCRIPTHLFQFMKYCGEISGISSRSSSGWGRAHRRAIGKWYTKYEENGRDPVHLAHLITKYIRRGGWSHKDVIRKAHVRSRNTAVRLCLQYALGKDMQIPDDKISAHVNTFLQAVKAMKKMTGDENVDFVCDTISANNLSWEHVPNTYLKRNIQVWGVLLRTMPLTAMIRHLGKLTSIGMFTENQASEFYIRLVVSRLEDDILLARARIHPLFLLIAQKHYNKGLQNDSRMRWTPNPTISEALHNAFLRLTKICIVPNENRKCLMAVSVGENMQKPICGSTISACGAAAAMVYSTLQSQEVDVLLFSNDITKADEAKVNKNDTLASIENKLKQLQNESGGNQQDLSIPLKKAMANKVKYDAIVVFTDSLTSCGHIHPIESLKQYMQYIAKEDYRFVVVSMTSDKYTIAAPDSIRHLDVVGFDTHTPGIITEFINRGHTDPSPADREVYLHEDEEHDVFMHGVSLR